MHITVIGCGSEVITKIGRVTGMITGKTIRFSDVEYEITYFNGSEFKNTWMREQEFIVTNGSKQQIGYREP